MTVQQDWEDWLDDFLHEIRAQMHELDYDVIYESPLKILAAAYHNIPLYFVGYLSDELQYFYDRTTCAYCEDERTHVCYCGVPCCDAHLRHGRCRECGEKADEQARIDMKVSER